MKIARLSRFACAILTGCAIVLPLSQSFAQQPEKFVIHAAPKPLPSIQFWDGDGKTRRIADFRDRVVLLHQDECLTARFSPPDDLLCGKGHVRARGEPAQLLFRPYPLLDRRGVLFLKWSQSQAGWSG